MSSQLDLIAPPPVPERKRTPICERCSHPHPPGDDCLEAVARGIRSLMLLIGDLDTCRACGKSIYWVRHLNGKCAPYTEAGLNHFIDCPRAQEFKR
jgi:hypothetical protein